MSTPSATMPSEHTLDDLIADLMNQYHNLGSSKPPVNLQSYPPSVINHNGEPYVPLKPIVCVFGLDWERQKRQLKRDVKRWKLCKVSTLTREGRQQALCLPLSKLPAWFYQLNSSEVDPQLRDQVIDYQKECDEVLPPVPSEILAAFSLNPDQSELGADSHHSHKSMPMH